MWRARDSKLGVKLRSRPFPKNLPRMLIGWDDEARAEFENTKIAVVVTDKGQV